MDDLVVIILTLLVAVVGALSQRKKRQQATQSPPAEGEKKPMDFWDMVMEQQNQPRQYREPEPYFEEEDEAPVEPVVETPKKPEYTFSAESEGQSGLQEELKKSLEPKSKKVTVDGEHFSLRKAVIYNEILKRKYT